MYLAVVEHCFIEMNEFINTMIESKDNPTAIETIRLVGKAYLLFILKNPLQAKLITSFDETDYKELYHDRLNNVKMFSNTFVPLEYIRLALQETDFQTPFTLETLSIMFHSSVLGLSTLLQSKSDWLANYYNEEIESIIENHLDLLVSLIGGK